MPAIFAFWDDLNPLNKGIIPSAGSAYYYTTSDIAGDLFNNVARWLPAGNTDYSGLYDFQEVLKSDGQFVSTTEIWMV